MRSFILSILVIFLSTLLIQAFAFVARPPLLVERKNHQCSTTTATTSTTTTLLLLGSGGQASIPSSPSERDNQAIEGCKAAISSPKTKGFSLIECEFPPLAALNKLGDGSLRSAREAEDANLAFALKLAQAVAFPPLLGPKTVLLTSSSATNSFYINASKKAKASGIAVYSLKETAGSGILSSVPTANVYVLIAPSTRGDYQTAEILASGTKAAVIIVNGFAKDPNSVSNRATMGYFLKPLTYNSQVAGYLIRRYPGPWVALDAVTKKVLGTLSDDEILVQESNTPDLRPAGRLVQKSVDERAILATKRRS